MTQGSGRSPGGGVPLEGGPPVDPGVLEAGVGVAAFRTLCKSLRREVSCEGGRLVTWRAIDLAHLAPCPPAPPVPSRPIPIRGVTYQIKDDVGPAQPLWSPGESRSLRRPCDVVDLCSEHGAPSSGVFGVGSRDFGVRGRRRTLFGPAQNARGAEPHQDRRGDEDEASAHHERHPHARVHTGNASNILGME